MEYIQETLRKVTPNKLEVVPFFDFLEIVCTDSSQQQQDWFREFNARWKENLHPKLSKSLLCHNKGCWLPKISDPRKKSRQPSWNNFIQKFLPGFSGSEIGSQESSAFEPTHFEDLLKITMWEELYGICGANVIEFIFDKCFILLRQEECFYSCIGRDGSSLQKCFNDYIETGYDRTQRPRIARGVKMTYQTNREAKPFQNPYEMVVDCEEQKQAFVRSRKRKAEKNISENIPVSTGSKSNPKKRRKMTELTENVQELHIQKNPVSLCPTTPAPVNLLSKIIPKCPPRWITPKPDIIQRIRDDRELVLKRACLPKTSCTDNEKTDVPTFVQILKDKYFKGKLYWISKQILPFIPKSLASDPIPEIVGLKLPPELAERSDEIQIVIHQISETAAKQYGLKICPRTRRHQKKKNVSVNTITNSEPEPAKASKELKWKPFDPTLTLSTSEILFRKTSACTWPSKTNIAKACSRKFELSTLVTFLQKVILGFPSSLPDVVTRVDPTRVASPSVLTQPTRGTPIMSKFQQSIPELPGMIKILQKFVSFHRRVTNVNTLVRNCVKFWEIKHVHQQEVKERKKLERKSERRKSKKSKIPLIDLTVDTPNSDTSTCTSNCLSPNRNLKNSDNLSFTSPDIGSGSGNRLDISGASSSEQFNDSKTSDKSITPAPIPIAESERKSKTLHRLGERISPKCILSALSQILHLSGGIQLLGSNANRKAFFKFLRKSIFKAGIVSSLQVSQLMANMNPMGCPWLNEVQDYSTQMYLLAKTVTWLFKDYILKILKIGFYATDVSNSRREVVFFLRNNWTSVSDKLKHRYINSGNLKKVTHSSQQGRPISPSGTMRIIPKKNNDVRPIFSLTKKIKLQINPLECSLLLNYLTKKIAPHGTTDPSDIRRLWKSFLKEWERRKCTKLYFIRVDIRDAYPSVLLPKLKEILLEQKNEKLILKSLQLVGGGRKRTKESLASVNYPNSHWHSSVRNRPCIVQDTNKDRPFDSERILSNILGILNHNIIKIGKVNYKFSNGLPQGWSLSQALCNIYYGHMDSNYFDEFLHKPGEFFVRSVDDYFYISPNPYRIARFFRRMRNGILEYACTINPEKSLSNIYVNASSQVETLEWVPYCGWRFCLDNGHVARDFSSYAGQDISSTLTFNLSLVSEPEKFIQNRMGVIIALRLHHILLDPAINCRERILTTVFEAALMLSFRFYAICRVIFPTLNVITSDNGRAHKLLEALIWGATKLHRYVRRNNAHLYNSENSKTLHRCSEEAGFCYTTKTDSESDDAKKDQSIPKIEPIVDEEIYFLIYYAFSLKLKKHYGVFKGYLLRGVSRKISKHKQKIGNTRCDELVAIVGKGMPEAFRKIRI